MNKKTKNIFFNIIMIALVIIGIAYILQESFLSTTLNDYYWHYKVGEWIIKNKSIPTSGIFSWYALKENLYWFSHEWLSAVLIYIISFNNPIKSIIVTKILCIIFFLVCLFITRTKVKDKWLTYIIYSFFLVSIFEAYFYPRPHIFSYFLLFGVLFLLYNFIKTENAKFLIGLPIISILWANIHGGSSNLVYILQIFFLISTLFDFTFEKIEFTKISRRSSLYLLMSTIVSTLCLIINPHGYKILAYPFENMQNEFMMKVIVEWASPDIKTFSGLYYIIPIVIVGISLITTTKKIKCYDLLMFLFFAYMYFRSERFITLFLISSIFYFYEYAPTTTTKFIEQANIKIKMPIYAFISTFAICYLTLAFITAFENKEISIKDNYISQEALPIIKALDEDGMYNHYNLGGELIYNDINVFIDGRADMYSTYNFEDFYTLSKDSLNEHSESQAKKLIEKYNLTSFICVKTENLNLYLQNNKDKYELVYEDENINIYIDKEYYKDKMFLFSLSKINLLYETTDSEKLVFEKIKTTLW